MINSFSKEYRFLSNFYPSPMGLDLGPLGKWSVDTVEHVYQAAKAADDKQAIWVLQSFSPSIAKARGKEIEKISDWDTVKLSVMTYFVGQKFDQNPDLAKLLLATGDEELVEGNWWGDTYWGVCRGKGENHLGRILMNKRTSLMRKQNA